jgi:hypothetical protein
VSVCVCLTESQPEDSPTSHSVCSIDIPIPDVSKVSKVSKDVKTRVKSRLVDRLCSGLVLVVLYDCDTLLRGSREDWC